MNFLDKVLIPEWRSFWKMYSIWILAILGCSGDLYNLAIAQGILTGATTPAALTTILHWVGFIGGAARLVKQQALQVKAEQQASS